MIMRLVSNLSHSANQQRGITLVTTLIFLILISLFAVTTFNLSSGNFRIVGNMEARQESMAAANTAIEQTLSSNQFAVNPEGVAASPVNIDIDGDGVVDYAASMTPKPKCYRARYIKNAELDPALKADLTCISSALSSTTGLDSPDALATAGNSACTDTQWNIRAEVSDPRSAAKVAVNQGASIRVLNAESESSCL